MSDHALSWRRSARREPWTPAEDAFIRNWWGLLQREIIAEMLDRSVNQVWDRANRLKINKCKPGDQKS